MDEDLTSRLNDILGDPTSMEKIKSLAAMFGSSQEEAPARQTQQPQRPQQTRPHADSAPSVDPELMQSVMKLAPALSHMRQEDDSTRLLRAIRPFLGERRRHKLDEAVKLMQLARMMPYLKSSGVLQSFL